MASKNICNSFGYYTLLCLIMLFFNACEKESPTLPRENENQPAVFEVSSFIYPSQQGQKIEFFFYDLKQRPEDGKDMERAQAIFVEDDMNGVRIPIFGDEKRPAHPSPGQIDDTYYEDLILSIKNAQNLRAGRDFYVFASKKLNSTSSFPAWVKDSTGIIPEQYALLLADYLLYMQEAGIKIDYLGIDNEFIYNEGNITPQKYVQTIDALKILLDGHNIPLPQLVGYEDYGPDKRNWVQELMANGWGDRMDIYGTHYYPQWRPKSKLANDLKAIAGRPFWSTEPHWDNKSGQDQLLTAEAAMVTLWDQTDAGMNGFMWWAYELNTLRGQMMRAASVPLKDASPIEITDIDGKDLSELGNLQTRAFIEDKTISVYVVNMSNQSYLNYGFQLNSGKINGLIQTRQWRTNSPNEGSSGNTKAAADQIRFQFNFPTKSVTYLSFELE